MGPEGDISRAEYEQFVKVYEIRHSELRLEMKELETDIKTDINELGIKVDKLGLEMANRSLDSWKLVGTAGISLISGYVLGLIQHIFLH